MSTMANVFMDGSSQAIRLPKEFRVSGETVTLTRVPRGILVSESDPWEEFGEGCRELGESVFKGVDAKDRKAPQRRDFTAGI